MSRGLDLTGERYGRLVAVSPTALRVRKSVVWLWRCDCGEQKEIVASDVRHGGTRSCGCLRDEDIVARSRTHGMHGRPEYQAWSAMKSRCLNPNDKDFHKYGGRGITVCDEWQDNFEAFFAHIGAKPAGRFSIDRIRNGEGYRPGNVRWATDPQQSRNRRTVPHFSAFGHFASVAEHAERAGLPGKLVGDRVRRGEPIEKALSRPARGWTRSDHQSRPFPNQRKDKRS